jgi:adenylate kinase
VERLSGRWTCRANGHVYHDKNNPPKQAKICDIDGSELYQRDDDQPETVVRRIQVYLEQTAPLIAYFRQRGNLIEIDGTQNIQKVTKAFLSALKK